MLIDKEIIGPGIFWYTDQATGQPRKLEVTPAIVKHFFEQGSKMLEAGLSIPVPLEHQESAVPLTASQKAAKALVDNAGWVSRYEMKGDQLFAKLDIPDPAIAKKLPHTIKWTSPHINSFTDGDGKRWEGVISHVALTSRPRITKQAPFTSVAAAMSMATAVTALRNGMELSKAGLLLPGEGGQLKPAYPMAFSLWGGIQLARGEMPPMRGEEKKKKPEPRREERGGGERREGGGERREPERREERGVEERRPDGGRREESPERRREGGDGYESPEEAMMQLEESLVDSDGDISIYEVLFDLLGAIGIDMPEGTTSENFCEKLYQTAMDKVKADKVEQKPEVPLGNKPPGGTNNLPKNPAPLTQEQPPMYMALSLEEIAKISDPEKKSLANALFSLQQESATQKTKGAALEQRIIAEASARRQARIDRLSRNLPGIKDKLEAQAKGVSLSLGTAGEVIDPMASTLDILETGLANIPDLLTGAQTLVTEQPHPQDFLGGVSEERRKAIVDELTLNGALAGR